MSGDVLTIHDIRAAVSILNERAVAPFDDGHYRIFLAPWQLSRVMIWLDPRLTEGDRILARERERYEERRSGLGKGWRSPYEWTCERRGIEPGAFPKFVAGPLPSEFEHAPPRASSGHGEGEERGS